MDWIKKYRMIDYGDNTSSEYSQFISGKPLTQFKFEVDITEEEFLSGKFYLLIIDNGNRWYIIINDVVDMTIENRKRKLKLI
jgi:hypothetical protein